jgi:hypothetical protein
MKESDVYKIKDGMLVLIDTKSYSYKESMERRGLPRELIQQIETRFRNDFLKEFPLGIAPILVYFPHIKAVNVGKRQKKFSRYNVYTIDIRDIILLDSEIDRCKDFPNPRREDEYS